MYSKNEFFILNFNHIKEIVLKVTLDLVLSKFLYLKFINKKI